MTLRDLQDIVRPGESTHVEFKLRFPEPEKIIREAIAFANTKGGFILLGVDDDGSIRGIKDPEETEQEFVTAMETFGSPDLVYLIEEIILNRKKSVLLIRIPESKHKPHVIKNSKEFPKGMAFFRVGEHSIQASRELFHILRHSKKKEGTKFEFGKKEKLLMQHFEQNSFITRDEFCSIAGINPYVASRTLVILTRANLLRIEPGEKTDLFFLNENQ